MINDSSPASLPFPRIPLDKRGGVRVVVTGQVGLDKKPLLQHVQRIAKENHHTVKLFNVGELMCAEAPDIVPKRVLDLPRQRLSALRRSVFKDILAESATGSHVIVNTHATFRWRHGLFHAYDHDQIEQLDADLYITIVDNVDAVHERLEREHVIRHTLKDILVWREEEIVVTEAMAEAVAGYGRAFVVSRSDPEMTAQTIYRLMFESHRKRVYPSFPMTHVLDQPNVLREIRRFRSALAEYFITFDPADVDEKRLLVEAARVMKTGGEFVETTVNGRTIRLPVGAIMDVANDIDGQIYARDFKLIDQSDMIVSYIPAMTDGRPLISSGVERELHHAFENTKDVYIIWKPTCDPSPFVSETATAIVRSLDELFALLQERGDLGDYQLPLKEATDS